MMTAVTLTGLELAAALCENVYGRANADIPISIENNLNLENKYSAAPSPRAVTGR